MYTPKQTITVLITILLLGLLATACISFYNIQYLSLPISEVTAIAAVLIPVFNGVGISGAKVRAARARRSDRPKGLGSISWPTIVSFVILAIYETVIATLALTHMVPPDDLTCHLAQQWGRLYSKKDALAIRRIQDAHQCCGLVTAKDMAWPFPDKNHPSDACIKAFDRQKSCLGNWRQDEQIYAGLLLFVALTTLGLKILFVGVPIVRKSNWWIHRTTGQRYAALTAAGLESGSGNENLTNGTPRRIEGAYRDNPIEETDEEDLTPRATFDAVTNRNDSTGAESRAPILQPSRLIDSRNEWAHE